jgi:hypothetical protein
MDVSTVFLSRLIGVAALILCIAMFFDRPPLLAAVELAPQDRAALYTLGIGGVIAGLAIVVTHNVWTRGLGPLVVTLCGWFMLVRGLLMLFVPTEMLTRLAAASHYTEYFYLYAAVPLVIGLYLCWLGFLASRDP